MYGNNKVISPIGERRLVVVRIIERVAGRYDVREMELGRVYRWCPERVVLERLV